MSIRITPINTSMSTKKDSEKKPDTVKYYCRHCGLQTRLKQWSNYSNRRCPKCSASTSPKRW